MTIDDELRDFAKQARALAQRLRSVPSDPPPPATFPNQVNVNVPRPAANVRAEVAQALDAAARVIERHSTP